MLWRRRTRLGHIFLNVITKPGFGQEGGIRRPGFPRPPWFWHSTCRGAPGEEGAVGQLQAGPWPGCQKPSFRMGPGRCWRPLGTALKPTGSRVWGAGGWGLGSQRSVFGSQHPPRSGLSSLSATPCPPWGWPEDTRQGQEDACPPTGQRLPPLLLLFPPHSDETGENRASQPPGRGSDPASTTDRLHAPGQPMPKRCTRGAARIQGEQPHSRGPGPASRSCCLLAPF